MPNMSKNWPTGNKGDQDVAGVADHPSQYLLLRKLDAGVNEEFLAKGVMKLCHDPPSPLAAEGLPNKRPKIASTSKEHLGAKEGSLRRVLLVKSRKDGKSMNFGFAEFATVQDAVDAHKKAKSSEGFTIKSKPVEVDFIHSGVFKTVAQLTYPVEDKFSFSALNNPDLKIIYRDEKAYCGELILEKEKTELEKKKAKIDELTKRARAAADDRGLLGPPTEKTIAASKKRKEKEEKTATSASKPVQFSVGRWEKSKAEIHGTPPKAPATETEISGDSSINNVADTSSPAGSNAQKQQSFRWLAKKGTPQEQIQCVLCWRQFETKEKIIAHELGTMHKVNLQNSELIERTLQKYPALRNVTVSRNTTQTPEKEGGDGYVDRAALRRQQFAQPKQPQQGQKRKEPEPETEDYFKPAENKAAKMLEKMGWSAGQGLGAEGTGRTEAIATELYAAGVGLGAVGGKVGDAVEEASKATGSTYADFLEQGKQKARERFENAG